MPGKGYMGWIRKERVILGNRAMMMDYGIKVPSQEYEQHYTLNQRRIVYMAVAGKLYAMFRIAYQSDPRSPRIWSSCTARECTLLWTATTSTVMSACWRLPTA